MSKKEISKRRTDFLINVLIVLLIGTIFWVTYYRFIKNEENSFEIKEINRIYIYSLNNKKINFSDIIENKEETYVLFLDISNCPSCIYKGFSEIQGLKRVGKKALAVVIYDYFDEWKSWAIKYEYIPLFMLKKDIYFKYIFSPYLPILVKFKKGKASNYKYIN